MKRRIIFAIFMIASVLGLRAQTDVTATYVVNPGFEDCTARTTNLAAAGSAAGDNYAEAGWTLAQSSAWSASAVVAYGGSGQVNGASAPSADNAGNGGNALGVSVGWGGTNRYLSTTAVTLPAGHYVLTINAYNNLSGATQFKSLNGFVPTSGSSYLSTKTSFAYATWVTDVITFDLTEATEGKFQIGGQAISGGSGSNAKVFFDNITLVYTDPLQAAKAALQTEIDKAKLCDAKEGLASAIAAAEDALANATTQTELEQALATLQAADKDPILRYENGLTDASATNGMTTGFVVNGTFTDNVNGWTCTGGFQNQARASNQQGDFTVPFFENWNGSAKANKMYQTITNVPNGTYKLKIAAFVNTLDENSQYVFANSDKTYLTTTAPTFYEVWTVVTDNTIEIGLEQTTATANWMGIDNVSLTYYGAGDVISQAQAGAHKTDWDEAVANAQAALANSDYANVTGKENTDLQAELAKSEPTTAQGYDDATAALRAATTAFTAAKASYDIFAQYNVTLDYALASKKPSVTATSTAATIIPALRAYYESNGLAEGVSGAVNMTSAITNATDPASNDGWTWEGSKNNPASNEPWTDANGTSAHSYFDGGNWGAQTWTTTMEQTVDIPAGRYLLTAKARAAAGVTFTMEAGGESVNLPHVGNAGNVFDRGWGDASLYFEKSTTAGVTIKVTASSSTLHEWFSISDFRLMQLEEITVNLADETDYVALASAISAAEAKTLGFDAGQYAPYNNVEAQKALAAAKAINPDVEGGNDKETVQNATSALASATWNANTADVNPIYNGLFATVTEGANYPEGWARTNAWGQMQSGISGDFATAYYNQPGSLVYGSTDYYSMPLPANQAYKLTFSYRSHEANSNNGLTVRVSSNGNDLIAPAYDGNGSTTEWKTDYAYFTTGDAGNYVIRLENSGNTWMTNVSMEKIDNTDDDLNGDGKIDDTDEWIEGLHYTAGDFSGNGAIEAVEVAKLANILVGKDTDYNATIADVNGVDGVTLADLTELVNVLNGTSEPRVVDETWKYATINATVYAEQTATENASGAAYTFNSATSIIKESVSADKYDMKDYLTTLNIATSLSDVKSVSVYAKGKENIAGLASISVDNGAFKSATYSAGNSPSAYASTDQANKNMYSDVVTVTGDNAGTYVAYLLPVSLSNGVTVTVRDNNGKFYSQDFTVTAGQENNLTFTETTATNNWMATIPGNINFSMLSTPGAHNAATSGVSSSVSGQAQCQSETIQGLLDNGVRAFDLRPQYCSSSTLTADNLTIYHGSVSTGVLYKDAIATIVSFLDAHPSEAISIIMTKEEGSGSDQTSTLIEVVTAIHNNYSSYFKVMDHSYYTLDDFRGKIFYGCRPNWYVNTMTRVENWPDDSSVTNYGVNVGGNCTASVEDAYNTSGDSKKTVVNAMLNLASSNTDRSKFHYTFTSVAWKVFGSAISTHANTQNPAAAEYISNTLTGPAGYVYADYMGSSSYSGQTLLKAVIEQNYKYVFKGRTRKQ